MQQKAASERISAVDTKKYEALITAARLGSFSAAADALGYTPAGIAIMADAVESALGVKLLNRTRHGVTLTESGREMINEINAILNHEALLFQYASELKGLIHGTVTIGSYCSIASHWLPDIIKDFSRQYPGIRISVREAEHKLLNQLLSKGNVDFIMTSYDPDLAYQWIPLKKDRMVVVVSLDHPLTLKKHVSVSDCLSYPFIVADGGREYDAASLLTSENASADIRFSTLENYSAIAMTESGLGISIMNELITQGINRKIKVIPLYPDKYIELGIACPDIKLLSPAAKKLINFIKEQNLQH